MEKEEVMRFEGEGGVVSSKDDESKEFSGGEQSRRRGDADRWIKQVGGGGGRR